MLNDAEHKYVYDKSFSQAVDQVFLTLIQLSNTLTEKDMQDALDLANRKYDIYKEGRVNTQWYKGDT